MLSLFFLYTRILSFHSFLSSGFREAEGVYPDAAPYGLDEGGLLEHALGSQCADRGPPLPGRWPGRTIYVYSNDKTSRFNIPLELSGY